MNESQALLDFRHWWHRVYKGPKNNTVVYSVAMEAWLACWQLTADYELERIEKMNERITEENPLGIEPHAWAWMSDDERKALLSPDTDYDTYEYQE